MIIEPNRRRRNRIFRAVVGVVALLFVGGLLASGWTLPAFSIASVTRTSSPPPVVPTPSAGPVAIVPTPEPTVPAPTPQPTPGADGCIPPPADLVPAAVVSHGARSAKVVALTFDDGYDAPNVQRILRFLVAHRVNATFFPTAAAVEMSPKTWHDVAAAGFPIGNHTYHHASLRGVCYQKQLAELNKAKSVVAGQALPMQGYMRPPYEEYDMDTRRAAASAAEAYVVLWDVDTFDWTGVSRLTIANRALKGKAGSIILMHTSPHATPAALFRIVAKFRARGYSFVTVGQMLGVPGPAPFPAPSPPAPSPPA